MIKYYTLGAGAESSSSGTAATADESFLKTSREVLAETPPAWRRQPSAAPSSIHQVLLRMQAAEGSTTNNTQHDTRSTPGLSAPPAPPATTDQSTHRPSAVARRGLTRKDPIMERLAKLQKNKAAAAAAGAATTTTTAGGAGAHWTQRKLSDMTSTSWRVFREQLGITVEVVNRRGSAATVGSREPSGRRAYTVDSISPMRCWEEAQLPYALGRLVAARYRLPTSIQAQCTPLAMGFLDKSNSAQDTASLRQKVSNKVDVIGIAETGSGKTAAYLVPVLADICTRRPKLLGNDELISLGPFALIMVPTRELAEQVTQELEALLRIGRDAASREELGRWEAAEIADLGDAQARQQYVASHNTLSELRVVKVVGGESSESQYQRLSAGAHIVVGTIGQLQALLEERFLSLSNTEMVIIDEADRMIDDNQQDVLIAVLERCPLPRQTLLFTATMSQACDEIARKYLSPEGFFVVRTPHRCASIRQSFELIPIKSLSDNGGDIGAKRPRVAAAAVVENAGADRERQLSPLIHPGKFWRLVTWLIYATGPIVIFAGEKRVCDALQDELRHEREHLLRMEEHTTLESLVGPQPEGLVFREVSDTTARAPASAMRIDNLTSIAVVHSELSQGERRRLVGLFHKGERQVLLTTDLLARGLDVPGVTLVINYDMPWPAGPRESPADAFVRYVHRIGRTGRAGATGVAVSFLSLPGSLARRAQQAVATLPGAAAPSSEGQRRIYAPGTSDAVKQRDRETHELTAASTRHGSILGEGGNALADDDADRNGSDYDDDGDGGAPPTRRARTEGDANGNGADRAAAFHSDESILRPLWSFLVACAVSNGAFRSEEEAEVGLRRQQYVKVNVPPELALIMTEMSRSSNLGTITK